jgi:outer membrane protein TolC
VRRPWRAGGTLLAAALLAGCATSDLPPRPPSRAPAPAAAPAPRPARGGPWTIEEAVERALACSSQIQALRAAVGVSEQRRRAATDIADPELRLGWGQDSSDGLRERTSTRTTITEGTSDQTSVSTQTKTSDTVSSGGAPQSSAVSAQTVTTAETGGTQGTASRTLVTSGRTTDAGEGWRIDARFFVPNPWLVLPRVSARKAEIRASQADLHAAEWLLACEVRRLCVDLNYLNRDQALAGVLVCLSGDMLKAMRARTEQGMATAADVVTAARRHVQTQDGFDQARQRCRMAQRDLAALLDLPPAALQMATNLAAVSAADQAGLAFELAESTAFQQRADLAALRWRALAARSAHREARNVRLPWIKEISASYRAAHGRTWGTDIAGGSEFGSSTTTRSATGAGRSQRTETGADGTADLTRERISETEQNVSHDSSFQSIDETTVLADRSDGEEWWVGFALDVPIFSWVKNHADEVLLAQCKLADVNASAGMRQVSREVRDAIDELEESQRQQARYETEVAPLIAEMRQTLAALGDAPNAMPDQVAATEMQMVDSLRLELAARRRYHLALLHVDRASGVALSARPAADKP